MAQKACYICNSQFWIKPCHTDILKTCSKECAKKLRSINAKKVFEKLGAPIFRNGALEKMTATKKKQSKEGKLGHLYSIQNKKGEWTGDKNPNWQPIGTLRNDGHGYIMIKISETEWIQEHVHNIEKDIGRKIDLKKECVHHIDGIKHNNDISNLFLTTHSYHKKLHQSIFMDTIKELMDKNIVYFDRNEKKYKVRENIQLTFSS